jgi:hypothetical protein
MREGELTMRMTMASVALCLSQFLAQTDPPSRPAPASEMALRAQLLDRARADQEARQAVMQRMKGLGRERGTASPTAGKGDPATFEKLAARLKAVDEDNTRWLAGVVEKHGWLTSSLVGRDGADAAWLLVQHADHDPKLQRRCLDLMSSLPREEVSRSNLAYLTDRVLLAEGKKQRYGTQFTRVDSRWRPRPLEDETNVDRRRAEVGLPPLADYTRLIEREYGSPGQ